MIAASVVIPAKDESERLPQVLAAVLAQAARLEGGAEVLVADSGSRDATAAIARALGARVVDAASARTIAAVRNMGARAARGRVLAFLDADCVPRDGWLEAGVSIFEDASVGAAGLAPRVPDDSTWIARAGGLAAAPRRGFVREPTRWLPSANLFVRAEAFEAARGFDESLATCEDYDLTTRIRASGARLVRDARLETVHLREPSTVRELFTKERWRGIWSMRGALAHGIVPSELPSLVLPFAHLLLALGVVAASVAGKPRAALALLGCALVPSLALALRAARAVGQFAALPRLFAFFLVYGAARVAALASEVRTLGTLGRTRVPAGALETRR